MDGQGRYRELARLGAGAMGEVFRVLDTHLNREVALKRLPGRGDPHGLLRERLLREARSMARLDHPHLVRLLDFELDGPDPALVMELIPGTTLQARLAEAGPLDPRAGLRMAHELAAALDALHGVGVLHRDVKPGNIMLRRDSDAAVLMDLGLAALDSATRLTATGHVLGTPRYLPPEGLAGRWTPASDQYQLAAVLFEALAGLPMIPGRTLEEIGLAIERGTRSPVPARDPPWPPEFGPALARAAAVDPGARFPDCTAFAHALGPPPGLTGSGLFTLPAPPRPPAAPAPPAPRAGRRVAGAGLGLLGLLGLLAGFALRARPAPPELAWAVVGDALVVEATGGTGGPLTLEVDGVAIPAAAGNRLGFRGLPRDREVAARVVWPGGASETVRVRSEGPAVGEAVLLAPDRRVELTVLRPCRLWFAARPAVTFALGPGPALLAPAFTADGDLELVWEESGLEFRRTHPAAGLLEAGLARLERALAGLDPVELLGRPGSRDPAGPGLAAERRAWAPVAGWLPELLAGPFPQPRRQALVEALQAWQATVAVERRRGADSPWIPVDPAGPGGRDRSPPPRGARRIDLEPVGDPVRRAPGAPLRLATPGSKVGWNDYYVLAADALLGRWPPEVPTDSRTLAVHLRFDPLPDHVRIRLQGTSGRASLLEVTHPAPHPREAPDLRGWVTLRLPADCGPEPGAGIRLEARALEGESAGVAELAELAVSWEPAQR